MDYIWSFFYTTEPVCPVEQYKQKSAARKASIQKLKSKIATKTQNEKFYAEMASVYTQLLNMDLTKVLKKASVVECRVKDCPHHPVVYHHSKVLDELIKRVPIKI